MAGEAELWAKGLAGAAPAVVEPFARPVGDTLVNGWTTNTGATTGLFDAINEAVANDGDYIRSPLSPTVATATYEVALSPVFDPGVDTGHILRYRYRRDAAGNPMAATLRLYEGATQRDSVFLGAPPTTFTSGQRTLPTGSAALITNYANLSLRIEPAEEPATPTLVGAGSFTQTATNGAGMAPTLPSGWAADDIHVLVASRKDTTVNMTALSGWTQALASNSGTTNRTEVWWRRAVAGDAQPTVTFGSGTVLREVQIFGIRGCPTSGSPFAQTSGAVDAISIRANASSTTVATTDVTPAAASFGLFVFAASSGPTSGTTPSGWSTFVVNRSGNNGIGLGYATRTYNAGGAYGGPTTTISQAGVNHGVLLSFRATSVPSRFEVAWVELEVPALPSRSVSGAGVAQRATGAPVGAVIALDSFVGAAAELSTHAANTGHAWAMHPASGVTTSLSGDGRVAFPNTWTTYWLNAVPSSPDYEVATDVTFTVSAAATWVGVVLRASPTVATWYYAFYYRATNVVSVDKSVAGTTSNLASAAQTFNIGQTYRLRATVSGGATTTIRVYIDDVLTLTATDSSSPITAVGRAGFSGSGETGTGVRLDNFAVTDPSPPAVQHIIALSGAATARPATGAGTGVSVPQPRALSGARAAQSATGTGTGVRHRSTTSGAAVAQAATGAGAGISGKSTLSGSQRVQSATASGTGLRHRNAVSGAGVAQRATGTAPTVPVGSDSFTGAAVELSLHTSDSGHAWVQHPIAFGPIALSGTGALNMAQDLTPYFLDAAPPSADYEASLDFTYDDDGIGGHVGLLLRVNPTVATWYGAYHSSYDGGYFIDRAVGGGSAALAFFPATLNPNQSYRLRATVEGSGSTTIRLYLDGALVGSVTDATPITPTGRAGVLGYATGGTGTQVDNFVAGTLAGPTSITHRSTISGARAAQSATGTGTGVRHRSTTSGAAVAQSATGAGPGIGGKTTVSGAARAQAATALPPAGGAVAFIGDTFTDTAGTALASHAGEDAAWTLHAATPGGALVISDANRVRAGNTTATIYYDSTNTPPAAEYDLTFVVRQQSGVGAIGVIARLNVATIDGYLAEYLGSGGGVFTLYRLTGGAPTTLGTWTASIGDGSDATILFQVRNATKKMFVNGVERIASSDNTVAAAGVVGLYSNTSSPGNATAVHIDTLDGAVPSGGGGGATITHRNTVSGGSTAQAATGAGAGLAFRTRLSGVGQALATGTGLGLRHRATLSGAGQAQAATGTGGGIATGPPPTRTTSGSAVAQPATASGLGLRQRRTTSGVAVAARATGAGAGLRQQRTTSGSATAQRATGSGLGLRQRVTTSGGAVAQAATASGLGLRHRVTTSGAAQAARATGAGAGLQFRTRLAGTAQAQAATGTGLGLRQRRSLTGAAQAQATGAGLGVRHRVTLSGSALSQRATGTGDGVGLPAPRNVGGSATAQAATGSGLGVRQRVTVSGTAQAQPATGSGLGLGFQMRLAGAALAQRATGGGPGLRQQRTTSGAGVAARATGTGAGLLLRQRLAGSAQAQAATGGGPGIHVVAPAGVSGLGLAQRATGGGPGLRQRAILYGTATAQAATASGLGLRHRGATSGSAQAQAATGAGPGLWHRATVGGAAQAQRATGSGPGLDSHLRLSGAAQAQRATGAGGGVRHQAALYGVAQVTPATGGGPGLRQRRTHSGAAQAQRATSTGPGIVFHRRHIVGGVAQTQRATGLGPGIVVVQTWERTLHPLVELGVTRHRTLAPVAALGVLVAEAVATGWVTGACVAEGRLRGIGQATAVGAAAVAEGRVRGIGQATQVAAAAVAEGRTRGR